MSAGSSDSWDRFGHLFTADEREDGDDVAGEAADQEHDAAEEGADQHPVRIILIKKTRGD